MQSTAPLSRCLNYLLKYCIITIVTVALSTYHRVVVHAFISSSHSTATYDGVITGCNRSSYIISLSNNYISYKPSSRTCIFSLNYQNGGDLGDTSSSSQPPPILPNTSDPYLILNVHYTASKEVIKKAYRDAALQYHPDRRTNSQSTEEEKQQANDDFARINAAYHSIVTGEPFGNGRRVTRSSIKTDNFSGGNTRAAPKPRPSRQGQGQNNGTWSHNTSFNPYTNVNSHVSTENSYNSYMKTYAEAYYQATGQTFYKPPRRQTHPRQQPNKSKQDEIHQRMKGAEFYDAKSFHERWNAATQKSSENNTNDAFIPFVTSPEQDRQERKQGGDFFDSEKFHQTWNPQPKNYQPTVKQTQMRNRGRPQQRQHQMFKGGEFFDAKSFHEKWSPKPQQYQNAQDDGRERVKGAEYYDAEKFHETFNKQNLRSESNQIKQNTQGRLKLDDFFDPKSFHEQWDASGNGNSNIGIQTTNRGSNAPNRFSSAPTIQTAGSNIHHNLSGARPRKYTPDTANNGYNGINGHTRTPPRKTSVSPPKQWRQLSADERKMRGDFFDSERFHSQFNPNTMKHRGNNSSNNT